MCITYKSTINNYYDLDDLLWSGARDRWKDATDEQKEAIWDRLKDFFYDGAESLTAINDVIWFECDDIFFSDDFDTDDDLDNDEVDNNEELYLADSKTTLSYLIQLDKCISEHFSNSVDYTFKLEPTIDNNCICYYGVDKKRNNSYLLSRIYILFDNAGVYHYQVDDTIYKHEEYNTLIDVLYSIGQNYINQSKISVD